jgi:hypothetical protein
LPSINLLATSIPCYISSLSVSRCSVFWSAGQSRPGG